jgi:hypothetical protein
MGVAVITSTTLQHTARSARVNGVHDVHAQDRRVCCLQNSLHAGDFNATCRHAATHCMNFATVACCYCWCLRCCCLAAAACLAAVLQAHCCCCIIRHSLLARALCQQLLHLLERLQHKAETGVRLQHAKHLQSAHVPRTDGSKERRTLH